jgi:hypothetical protein
MQRFQSVLMLIALVGGTSAWSQRTSSGSDDQNSMPIAAIRIVNTAEAQYLSIGGHYGSLDELRSSGTMRQAQSMFPQSIDMSHPGQPLAGSGFTVRLNLSADNKGYQLSVTQDAKPFLVGFFSDERGLIYEGHPLQ